MKQLLRLLAAALVVFAVGFLAGWRARGRQTTHPELVVRVDTIYYERPAPVALSRKPVTVNVPRLLFAPDPVVAENATTGCGAEMPPPQDDSVAMEIHIETRIYEDTLYRAQVSGPALGEFRPALDWVELYAQTRTITRRNRFALTAGVGAAYTPRGIQPTIGVQLGVVLWGF